VTDVAPDRRQRNLNIPNALTLLRLVLVPVLAWLMTGEDISSKVAAFAVFAVGSFTDYIDGLLARRWGMVTDFGKLADPIADKALTGTALIGLSLLGELTWWATVIILVRELGITALREAVRRSTAIPAESRVIPASRAGKLKTALQVLGIGLYLFPPAAVPAVFPDLPLRAVSALVMTAAVVVTVVSGLDYLARASRLWRVARSSGPADHAEDAAPRGEDAADHAEDAAPRGEDAGARGTDAGARGTDAADGAANDPGEARDG
jgi:CDP-diacylglycerol---glycerol-3-phosphate 3-phosphatidyltransferase